MQIWQKQIQEIAIWNRPCRRYLQRKIDEIFKDLPNEFGIADDILAAGYDVGCKDHDNTL